MKLIGFNLVRLSNSLFLWIILILLLLQVLHATQETIDIDSIFHCNSVNESNNSNNFTNSSLSSVVDIPRSLFLGDFDKDNNRSRVYLRVDGTLDCVLEENRAGIIPRYLNETSWWKLKSHFLSQNGSLRFKGEVYSPSEFCANEITEKRLILRFCKSRDDFEERRSPVIRKCCPSGQVYDLSEYGNAKIFCVLDSRGEGNDSSSVISRPLEESVVLFEDEDSVNNNDGAPRKNNITTESGIEFVPNGKGWCKSDDQRRKLYSQRELLQREKPFLFRITSNGTVLFKERLGEWNSLSPGSFCMEKAINIPNEPETQNETESDLVVVLCNGQSKDNEIEKKTYKSTNPPYWVTGTYVVFLGVACLFLILTVGVHLALWDKQNVHSWTLLCSALSMTAWYFSVLLTHYYNYKSPITGNNNGDLFCVCLAVTTHFFMLFTFSWITLINFDIWSTFTNLKMISRSKSFQWKRFAAYSLFAFSVPAIVVTVGLVLDSLYKNDVESNIVTPNYGGLKCFVSIEKASLEYIYAPLAILIITNILFFLSTIRTLYKLRQSTKVATTSIRRQSISTSDKKSVLLFTKLFFVMGVVWTFELGVYFIYLKNPMHPLVYIADIIHNLQPIAVFIIFVCKKEVLKGLETKYPTFKKMSRACSRGKEFLTRRLCLGEGGGGSSSNGSSVKTDDTGDSSIYLSSSSTRSMSITSFTSFKFQPWKNRGSRNREVRSSDEIGVGGTAIVETVQPPDVQV